MRLGKVCITVAAVLQVRDHETGHVRKPPAGRPYNDHRTVLGGIMWVARTGSSWREMPEEFGKWESAYRRYKLWLRQGLWQPILEALGEKELPGPATK
jgi:transposase